MRPSDTEIEGLEMQGKITNKKYRFIIIVLLSLLPFFSIVCQTTTLRINEFLAINVSVLRDEDGEFSDWIEIFNPTSQSIELSGWSLTDDRNLPRKWLFPVTKIDKFSYLIVFASGKDRRIAGKKLHTNFKLSGSGEYLAMINPGGSVVTEFSPFYPAQEADVSYGFFSGKIFSFTTPTPGLENLYTSDSYPPPPVFSVGHGFYNSLFNLEITCPDQGTEIYYTKDGSKPSKLKGIKYIGPVVIDKTSIIRAIAVRGNIESKKVTTVTYLFPNDIVHQPNNPAGYPTMWGPYTGITGTAVADYEMDPELVANPGFEEKLKAALISIPVISLVTDRNFLFSKSQSPDTGGIYIYTGPPLTNTTNGTGWGWERPASFEYFDSSDSVSFQVDCALQLHGGHSRRPEKSPKHSFRLEFKEKYGPSRLKFPIFGNDAASDFDAIVLRAGFNNSWVHHTESERIMAQYVQDIWAKDTQREMGYYASHSNYAHLYINGLYWGIYCPSEKLDADFMATYFGGQTTDYDVVKDYGEVVNGDKYTWTTLMTTANAGLSDNATYQRIQGNFPDGTSDGRIEPLVDVVNLADYMIINFYNGNSDWDHHNWIAARNRINPGKGFRFFCWDEEKTLEDKNANILNENNPDCPSRIFQQLMKNQDFKRLFADRAQKFCFGNGVLTPYSAAERWKKRSSVVEKVIDAESARWGDYRRDVHRWQAAGPFSVYTKENNWIPASNKLLLEYFPQRTGIFVNQLRIAGWLPKTGAPEFMINSTVPSGSFINTGDTLTMIAASGAIYYTTDGSDPVAWNGIPLPTAKSRLYNGKIILDNSVIIRARCINNGEWSASTERSFIIKADYNDLKITEINYHPQNSTSSDEGELEFIEIKNTGSAIIDLSGCTFSEGIDFRFEQGSKLFPGDFAVLGSQSSGFYKGYGFVADGIYSGQLDNSGERIVLLDPVGDTIISMSYGDSSGWPVSADGEGKTIVPVDINPTDQTGDPLAWRASYHSGGSPGRDDLLEISRLENGMASENFTLYQNFPNPFRDKTVIPYSIIEEGTIELSVYDRYGHSIKMIEMSTKTAGEYLAEWDGTTENGVAVPAGVYFYRLTVTVNNNPKSLTKTIIRLR
jgi:hypothetical protein